MSVQNSDGIRQPLFRQLRGETVLEPIRERTKIPSRTAKVQSPLPKHDQLHISETHELIYQALVEKHGQAHADAWLEHEQTKQRGNLPLVVKASTLLKPRKQHHEPPEDSNQLALTGLLARFEPEPPTVTPPEAVKDPPTLQEQVFEQTRDLEPLLKPTGWRLIRVMLETAHQVAKARGYAPQTTYVTFFCPQEIVVKALGVNRSTVWRNLHDLKDLGLLDAREWKTDLRGNTCNGGYLWKVKLDPHSPHKPKLTIEEFKHPWRDLAADIATGRTSFNEMHQSFSSNTDKVGSERILEWALPLAANRKDSLPDSSLTDARTYSLESILDLPGAARDERNEMVKLTARAIGYCLGDTSIVSRHFYHRVLWNLLRQYDQGNDWFGDVYDLASRVRTDFNERYARRAGALFISRLKKWHLWQQLDFTPPYRVATGPLQTFMA
jgi:hypothetical protein